MAFRYLISLALVAVGWNSVYSWGPARWNRGGSNGRCGLWNSPTDCRKCWDGSYRFDWWAYRKDFKTKAQFDNDILTCSVYKNGEMSLTATLRKNERLYRQKSDVQMVVTLSTGSVSGSLYLMLVEGPRYEDWCTADTVGNIIPRTNRKSIPWRSRICNTKYFANYGSNCADEGELNRVALHRFKFYKYDKLNVTLIDLPFIKLNSFVGRGLALCSKIQLDKDGKYLCEGKIPICCKLGYDDHDALERSFKYVIRQEMENK